MKKILTLLALAGALGLSSCSDLAAAGGDVLGTVFEGSISYDGAVVTSASGIKTRSSVTDIGVKSSRGSAKVDNFLGAGNMYQTISVRANGKIYKGDVSYNGDRIYSGQVGTLRIGKKTGQFKGFEPTY